MNLALFDFDGTLTTREMLPDFVCMAVSPMRKSVGGALIAPWLLGYRRGWLSGVSVRAKLARVAFTGMAEADYLAAGERFAREALAPVLRTEGMARLHWHRGRGDAVAVVSGGFDVYLVHWCRAQGVELLCSQLEVVDSVLTGRYAGAQCVGDEKARRIRERYRLNDFERIFAYGDTAEDAAMLALADESWFRSWPTH